MSLGIGLGIGIRKSFTPTFSPSQLQELELWFKADTNVGSQGSRSFTAADKSHFEKASHADFNFSTTDLALSLWFQRDTTGNQVLISKYEDANNYWTLELDASNKLHFLTVVGGVTKIEITGTTTVDSTGDGEWNHVAISVDRDTAASTFVYLDGIDDTSGTPTVSIDNIDNTGKLYVGQFGDDTLYWNGDLSKSGIWKADTLSSTEVTFLFNSGNGLLHGSLGVTETDGSDLLTNLSAYWNCNEGDGTLNLLDAHTSGHDLTRVAAELVTNGAFAADTDWTKTTGTPSGWSIAAGVASSDGTQTVDSDLEQAGGLTSSLSYPVSFTVTNYSAGNITPVMGSTEGTDRAANGTHTETIVAGADGKILLRADLNFIGDVDDFTVVSASIPPAAGPTTQTVNDNTINENDGSVLSLLAGQEVTFWSPDVPSGITSKSSGLFDGIGNYVQIPSVAEFDFTDVSASPFTICGWIKLRVSKVSPHGHQAFSIGTTNFNAISFIMNENELPNFLTSTSGSGWDINILSDTQLVIGDWSHIAVTRTVAGVYTVYINGISVGTTTDTVDTLLDNFTSKLGGHYALNADNFLDGKLDDWRVYDVAKTTAEILALTNGTNDTTNLISNWLFDDGHQSTSPGDGDTIVSWRDKINAAIEAQQGSAGKRPTFKASAVNGKPGITFDGIDDLMVIPSAVLTGMAGAIWIVVELDSVPNTYQTMLSSSDETLTTKFMSIIARGNTANPHAGYDQNDAGTADLLDGDTVILVSTPYLIQLVSDGTTITMEVNKVAQTLNADTGANNGDFWDDTTAKDNVSIGAKKTSAESEFLAGTICEIVGVNVEPTAAEIAQVIAYLTKEYGEFS